MIPQRDPARLLAVARGEAPADLVVEGARVFCAFTREWLDTDVAVAEGVVAGFAPGPGGARIDGRGRYLVPGFVDAHVHIESSKLTADEFARVVVPRGTTTIVADPHEIANVLGPPGVRWLLDSCEGLPLDVEVMVPSCVPASSFESPRAPFHLDDMRALLASGRALGIGEMMNFPDVVAGAAGELAKLGLADASHADGHAPGLGGAALDAYLAAGISSDHEATTLAEALEKRRKGVFVLIREASNARNLRALLPLVRTYGPERCAFCTDDREPQTLVREGHLDQMLRVAVADDVPVEDALLLATLHPALCHGLRGVGAIAPGYRADLVLLDDLEHFAPALVIKRGRVVAEAGRIVHFPRTPVPAWVRSSVDTGPIDVARLRVPASGALIRVIEIVPEQLLTVARAVTPTVVGGRAVADPGRDLAKLAVVERHHASGRIGLGFVTGFGLRRGAFASSVAHDAHNLVCVGVDDDDIRACILRLVETGGGLVVYDGGRLAGELPLPIAGLMSDAPAADVADMADRLEEILAGMGVGIPTPFMTLSFLSLSVIPALRVTDQGVVDVGRARLVPLELSPDDRG